MFQTEWLINNSSLRFFIVAGIILLLSFSLGRIIQKRFKIMESHMLLSVPIGFFTIQIVHFIMYGIFILFKVDMDFLYWVSNVTYIGLFLLSIAFSPDWLPHHSQIDYKKGIGTVFGIGLIVGLLFFNNHLNQLEWFNKETPIEVKTALDELQNGVGEAVYSVEGIEIYYTKFQTMSYWTVSTAIQGGFTTQEINNYILPLIEIITLTSIGVSLLRFHNVNYALMWSSLIIMPLIVLNGITPKGSESLMLPTAIFIFTMVYFISNSIRPNRALGYIAIISSSFLFISHNSGIYFFGILSGLVIYASAKYNASPIFQLNTAAIGISVMITTMVYTVAGFTSVFVIIISLIFLIPLNIAIVSKNSTRIVSIDEAILESRKNIAIFLTGIIFVTSIIISIVNPEKFVPSFFEFYTENPISFTGNIDTNNLITGIIYISSIIIPLLLTIIFNDKTSRSSAYMVGVIFIIFNPFTISTLGGVIGVTNSFGSIVLISMIPLGFSIASVTLSKVRTLLIKN